MRYILSILIFLLCIFQIKGDKAETVVKFAKSKLGCGYIWSGNGQILTESLLNELYDKYPDHIDKNIVKKWIGKQVYDCSGFVQKAFKEIKIDLHHNAERAYKYTKWETKEEMSNYPKDKVFITYRYSKADEKMVHTGIHIGGGKFIHAKGSKDGVILESKVSSWTHWGIPKGLY